MTVPDHFPPPAWERVEGAPAGWHVWRVAATGSTNADLVAAAGAGAPDRTVLVAGHQTAGRGRLDRRWDAPPDTNLLVSILFRDVPEPATDLTRRVGLAAVGAVHALCAGRQVELKWPNDVLLDGVKLAGILAQRSPDGPVVVGLGLNVGWAPEGAARLDAGITPLDALRETLRAYDTLPADAHDAYRAVLATLGQQVRVELASGAIDGRAIDVERDGRLVVLDACAVTHRVDVGDVVHLRRA